MERFCHFEYTRNWHCPFQKSKTNTKDKVNKYWVSKHSKFGQSLSFQKVRQHKRQKIRMWNTCIKILVKLYQKLWVFFFISDDYSSDKSNTKVEITRSKTETSCHKKYSLRVNKVKSCDPGKVFQELAKHKGQQFWYKLYQQIGYSCEIPTIQKLWPTLLLLKVNKTLSKVIK
jgi:hypothetical protein